MGGDIRITTFFFDLAVSLIVVLPIYYAARNVVLQRWCLIVHGVALLFFLSPRLMLFYAAFWLVFWLGNTVLRRLSPGPAKLGALWALVLLFFSPILLWKIFGDAFLAYYNVSLHGALEALSPKIGQLDAFKDVFVPAGMSFAAFRAIDTLVKTYLGLPSPKTLTDCLSYGFFAPVFATGPLAEYGELSREERVSPSAEGFSLGLQRVLTGMFKVFVLSGPLQGSTWTLQNASLFPAWWVAFSAAAFFLFLYFNFSGYSDLAIGFAHLFGFRLKENFKYPLFQPSLQKFWASWHMSLTRLAQRIVFVPLGGMRKNRQHMAMIVTMLFIALWHGITLPMLVFGLLHGAVIVVQREMASRKISLERRFGSGLATRFAPRLFTFAFVALTAPLLVLTTAQAGDFYLALLGLN